MSGASITDWSVDVANVFDSASVNNTANWELVSDGADNMFDTADDVVIPISLDTDYMIGTNRIEFSTAAALGPETYRFRASAALQEVTVLSTVGTRKRVNTVDTSRPPTTTAPRPR